MTTQKRRGRESGITSRRFGIVDESSQETVFGSTSGFAIPDYVDQQWRCAMVARSCPVLEALSGTQNRALYVLSTLLTQPLLKCVRQARDVRRGLNVERAKVRPESDER